jgi:HEAT repeat protein
MLRFAAVLLVCTGLHAESAWDLLSNAASNRSSVMRVQAVVATSVIGLQPRAVLLLEHACTDSAEEVRSAAAQQLGEIKSTHSIPVLTSLLDDSSPAVAYVAAQALWKMKNNNGRKLIAAVLAGEGRTDSGAMHDMMHDAQGKLHDRAGLVKMGVNQGAGMLLGPFAFPLGFAEDLFKDKGAPSRVLSAGLLATDNDPSTLTDLESALHDKSPAVRAAAAKALSERGITAAISKLEPLLSDKNPGARLIAAAAIVRLQSRTIVRRKR